MYFSHLVNSLGSIEKGFKAKVQCRHFNNMGINLVQDAVRILHPLSFRIPDQLPRPVIVLFFEFISAHEILGQINQL